MILLCFQVCMYVCVSCNLQEAVVVKLRLKNTALKVQKRKLLMQLRQVCVTLTSSVCFYFLPSLLQYLHLCKKSV